MSLQSSDPSFTRTLRLLRSRGAILFSTLSLLLSPPLLSNDASIGGLGSDLVLLSEGRIAMVSEDIRMIQKSAHSSEWSVYAHYLFANGTDDSVTITMGFPEPKHCHGEEEFGDAFDPRFRNLTISIDGEPVAVTQGMITRSEWDFCLGTVHLFSVTFAPRQRLTIDHAYDYTGTASVEGYHVDYLTRTGRLWNGPIGSARFTVVAAGLPTGLLWPSEYRLVDHYRDRFPTDPYDVIRSVYVFEQREWTPTADFSLLLPLWWGPPQPECCPLPWEVAEAMKGDDPERTIRELAGCLSDSGLRICRNLIFARYGRTFADAALNDLFYATATPRPGHPFYEEEEGTSYIGLAPNPRYADALLTHDDRELAALLRRIEEERADGSARGSGE